MARQAELTFLAINQSRTTKEQAMLRRGLHGAYELACADASANGFSDEKRVSRSFDALLRPHDRDPLFHSEEGGLFSPSSDRKPYLAKWLVDCSYNR
jgi:hypothetical protein